MEEVGGGHASGAAIDVSQIGSRLWVGGAIDALDQDLAVRQAEIVVECHDVGLVIDCRKGLADGYAWAHLPGVTYLNIGVDDAGGQLPDTFYNDGVEAALGIG